MNKKEIAKQVLKDINEVSIKLYDDGLRWHLGASLIGHECKRYLWYIYRWCFKEKFDGRMYRLFNRGHREEERIITYLREAGFTVYDVDKDGKQFRISNFGGHFGGSLDGIAYFPERYNIKEPVLLEFKTNGTGAGFNKVLNMGMREAKEMHWAQTCTYGTDENYQFKYCLYFVVNKNDDSMHIELVELDKGMGDRMRGKAEVIIMSQTAPARLSDNPTFHKCSYCAAKDMCHSGALPLKNCRSCKHAHPADNAEFKCDVFDGIIPREYVADPANCEHYEAITRDV